MNTWNETTKRWLPLVEEMERLGFEDYAEPEIYRSAEATIAELLEALELVYNAVKFDGNRACEHGITTQYPTHGWYCDDCWHTVYKAIQKAKE